MPRQPRIQYRQNDPAKLALAARLRRGTILSTREIAAAISLGIVKCATTALNRWMRHHPPASGTPSIIRQEQREERIPAPWKPNLKV